MTDLQKSTYIIVKLKPSRERIISVAAGPVMISQPIYFGDVCVCVCQHKQYCETNNRSWKEKQAHVFFYDLNP